MLQLEEGGKKKYLLGVSRSGNSHLNQPLYLMEVYYI